ncbi:hypothetical protein D8674_026714 [Pyrus ussuriensis x Pyrus communis]|uniref:Transmembrane protein n=1 Tax=Pyrus ussuriensis x Pyrus communis TaxID=2448454 RepID=A0A5N5IEX2_9ROSA|nr:hypothetical protein D8674_026714 [Pyrus ussuriensis x Pyrus communis]
MFLTNPFIYPRRRAEEFVAEETERDATAEQREGTPTVARRRCRGRTEESVVEEVEKDATAEENAAAKKREGDPAAARRGCRERKVLFWVVGWNLLVVVVHGGWRKNWVLGFVGFFGFVEATWNFGEF